MYLDCFKNCGKPYLRIMHNYYNNIDGKVKITKKTIKNLGPLEKYDDGEPDFLNRFRERFKNGELDFCNDLDLPKKDDKKYFSTDEINFSLNPKNLGYLILNKIYSELGIGSILNRIKSDSKIKYDLNGLVKVYVFDRVLDPHSKIKAFEKRDKYLFSVTNCENEKEIYKPLDVLNDNIKQIQNRINIRIKKSSIGRNTELTYYDVTNYYFETMYGDDDIYEEDENGKIKVDEKGKPIVLKKGFKKNGVSKENRKEPIVQMGLFIDNNGLPVSFKLFPGNTQDKTTFKNVLENDVKEMNLGRIVVVADNGMNTQENKYLIVSQGNGYIVSKSVKKSWTKLGKWALDDKDYVYIRNDNGEVVFKYKSRINEIKLTYKNKDGTKSVLTTREKEIIYWSKKHYDKEVFQNKKFIEYLESCKENPNKLKDKQRKSQEYIKVLDIDKKTGEVIKTDKLVVFLDEKLEKYKETMGFYCIVSSEIDSDDKELINKYHGLSRIEDSFRIIKSDLEGRPIHVWTEEHIKAHFLICFIALTIIRIIQHKVLKYQDKPTLNVDGWEQGITAEKIKETLNNFQADKICEDYYKISDINEEMDTILKALGATFNFEKYTYSEIKEFQKMINSIVI